jgi:hypothetical protein
MKEIEVVGVAVVIDGEQRMTLGNKATNGTGC